MHLWRAARSKRKQMVGAHLGAHVCRRIQGWRRIKGPRLLHFTIYVTWQQRAAHGPHPTISFAYQCSCRAETPPPSTRFMSRTAREMAHFASRHPSKPGTLRRKGAESAHSPCMASLSTCKARYLLPRILLTSLPPAPVRVSSGLIRWLYKIFSESVSGRFKIARTTARFWRRRE